MRGLTMILAMILASGAGLLSGSEPAQGGQSLVPAKADVLVIRDAALAADRGEAVTLASGRHHRHGFEGRFHKHGRHFWGEHRWRGDHFHRHGPRPHRHRSPGFFYGDPNEFFGTPRHFGGRGVLSLCFLGEGVQVCFSDRAYRQPHRW